MKLRRLLCCVAGLLMLPGVLHAQSDELLTHLWQGIQQAQQKVTTACGTVTETRTSRLMVRPMVLHGKFCMEGTTKFMLEYFAPHAMHIRFNVDYLNVSSDGQPAEAFEIGNSVRRAQSSFSRENSIDRLKKDFTITVQESVRVYEMKLVPRSERFRRRLNYMVVKLDKRDFLPRSLEVDGKSGVNSVFAIDITTVNATIPQETFTVTKPK